MDAQTVLSAVICQRLSVLLGFIRGLLKQAGVTDWPDLGQHGFTLSLMSLCCIALILWIRTYKSGNYRKYTTEQWVTLLDLAKTAYLPKHKAIVFSVLNEGLVDVNGYMDYSTGLTLFLCACLSGQMDLVSGLIDKGGLSIADSLFCSVLNTEIIFYTICMGADYKAVTLSQNSALVLATYACSTVKGSDPRLVDLLACRGVDVNKRDDQGNSALSIAALYGRADIISMLLEYGADCHMNGSSTVPPLDLAGSSGNLTAAKLLEAHTHT